MLCSVFDREGGGVVVVVDDGAVFVEKIKAVAV